MLKLRYYFVEYVDVSPFLNCLPCVVPEWKYDIIKINDLKFVAYKVVRELFRPWNVKGKFSLPSFKGIQGGVEV